MYRRYLKRPIDLVISGVALLLLTPLLLVIMLMLTISNGGQPLFTQNRPGLGGRVFKVIKFKTMNDRRTSGGELLSDADRLTPVGKLVRRTSLDELPQLINVVKGDMSLVGPRPLLVDYLPLYSFEQARRHEVRPGITGWAQVNGRNAISWEEKFRLDVLYVDNLSFLFDLRILLLTVFKVLRSDGISQNGQATMEKFKGSS